MRWASSAICIAPRIYIFNIELELGFADVAHRCGAHASSPDQLAHEREPFYHDGGVTIKPRDQINDVVRVAVTDTGIGIAPEDVAQGL